MLKEAVLELLRSRHAKPGETVEFSWFWFQVTGTPDRLDLETLDFQKMASFTRDFSVADRIHAQQMEVLKQQGVEPLRCTLRDYGRADTYYDPGDPDAYLYRLSEAVDDFSGWVIGTRSRPVPVNNLHGHDIMSLYEICLRDRRFLPYWLLPQGWSVVFENGQPLVLPPGQSDKYFQIDDSPRKPWWKFWQ